MPTVINIGNVNVNTPQQNAGAFFGETVISGWDANQKQNQGHGGIFGSLNLSNSGINYNFDGNDMIDGAINDQDVKSIPGGGAI